MGNGISSIADAGSDLADAVQSFADDGVMFADHAASVIREKPAVADRPQLYARPVAAAPNDARPGAPRTLQALLGGAFAAPDPAAKNRLVAALADLADAFPAVLEPDGPGPVDPARLLAQRPVLFDVLTRLRGLQDVAVQGGAGSVFARALQAAERAACQIYTQSFLLEAGGVATPRPRGTDAPANSKTWCKRLHDAADAFGDKPDMAGLLRLNQKLANATPHALAMPDDLAASVAFLQDYSDRALLALFRGDMPGKPPLRATLPALPKAQPPGPARQPRRKHANFMTSLSQPVPTPLSAPAAAMPAARAVEEEDWLVVSDQGADRAGLHRLLAGDDGGVRPSLRVETRQASLVFSLSSDPALVAQDAVPSPGRTLIVYAPGLARDRAPAPLPGRMHVTNDTDLLTAIAQTDDLRRQQCLKVG